MWLPLLLACAPAELAPAAPPARVEARDHRRTLGVDVVVRVDGEAPGAWTATAVEGAGPAHEALPSGRCVRAGAAAPTTTGDVDELHLVGAFDAEFERATGNAWAVRGPRGTVDASWAVADLTWRSGTHSARTEGLVRFGPVPALHVVSRELDGGVVLRWDPTGVGEARVRVVGPAGALTCGADVGGAELPWWAVPARGGTVTVETTRVRQVAVGSRSVWGRATFERVVRLDVPLVAQSRGREGAHPDNASPNVRTPRTTTGVSVGADTGATARRKPWRSASRKRA